MLIFLPEENALISSVLQNIFF